MIPDDDTFPWFPWYENKYLDKTKWFNSVIQEGIYRTLCAYYCKTGPLRDDEEDLRAIVRMSGSEWDEAWARYWPKIKDRFFTLENGFLHNSTGDEVREAQRKTPRQKSTAGKAGAKVRWDKERAAREGRELPNENAAATQAVRLYNDFAAEHKLPECAKVSKGRLGKLKARLRDGDGIEGWKVALEKLGASDFLMGRTPRAGEHKNWSPGIDFLLQESSFAKLMEGKYDNRTNSGGPAKPPRPPAPSEADRRSSIAAGLESSGVATLRSSSG